jgi:DNA repair protein RAD16
LLSGTALNNYAHIFDILIRLRQAVDHPYLVIYSDTQSTSEESKTNFHAIAGQKSNKSSDLEDAVELEDSVCSICHEPTEEEVRATCGHAFCRSCITDYMNTIGEAADFNDSMASSNNDCSSNNVRRITAVGCPECKQPLTVNLLQRPSVEVSNNNGSNSLSVWDIAKRRKKSILDKIDLTLFQSSTKLEALMEVVENA